MLEGTPAVRAAGGVVWIAVASDSFAPDVEREVSLASDSPAGDVRILVVHRPRYDDWTLPKGKAEPGETDDQCARREVFEETGLELEPGDLVARVRYHDQQGRLKEVVYFEMAMRMAPGEFVANDEVDLVQWLSLGEARRTLSYGHDVGVVDQFSELHGFR